MVVKVALKSISPPRNQQNKRWWRIQDMPAMVPELSECDASAIGNASRGVIGPQRHQKFDRPTSI